MNLFDAYGSASEHDMITRIGMDERYGVPPQGTFIETLAAVSEFIGHDDVFTHDWIVVQNKPLTPQAPPPLPLRRTGLPEDAGSFKPPKTRQPNPDSKFPDITVDAAGMIVLCPGCSGSDASKDGDCFICRSCGSVWRGR